MRTRLLLAAIIVLVFVGSSLAKRLLVEPLRHAPCGAEPGARIVSLAPSITETLFALGLGDRVKGVSQFCRYPPQAQDLPKTGGYVNPNFEAIVALRPDLVVLLEEHAESMPAFEKLGLPTLVVCHKNIDGILASIATIGRACGAEAKAETIVADIEARLTRVRQQTAGLPRRRVLVAVNRRAPGAGKLEDVYVAASDGHLARIVELAGGQNACVPGAARFPVVSSEGILHIAPDVIIDIVDEKSAAELGTARIRADWRQVGQLAAVRHGRVYVVDDDHASIPGPGFVELVEWLARRIHRKVDWQ
jgi:iron complex transport system substrate-binding protein